jgi:MEMO1 family protein
MNPKLRPVEAFPAEVDGRQVIALRDPQGYAAEMIFVPRETLGILSLFDGEHSLRQIQQIVFKDHGQMLHSEQLEELIEQLDKYHFLESPRFENYREEIRQAFRNAPIRPPAHAGAAYENDPEALRNQLDSLFLLPEGPGLPELARTNGPLSGLVAPHIDLHRGGTAYAHAYKALAEAEPADVYVILGVAHNGPEHLFVLTNKDFVTPFGVVKTEQEFNRKLQEKCRDDLFADEISHKSEHSIEFQIIFLQHLLGQKQAFKIVPILVGSFYDLLENGQTPDKHPDIDQFCEALRTTCREFEEQHKRVCLIAGIDLAHVGRQFGDSEELSADFLSKVRQGDEKFLQSMQDRNFEAVFEQIKEEKDWRKVCGFPAAYTFLRALLPESRPELLKYQQWADCPAGCSVSFVSMAFRPSRPASQE